MTYDPHLDAAAAKLRLVMETHAAGIGHEARRHVDDAASIVRWRLRDRTLPDALRARGESILETAKTCQRIDDESILEDCVTGFAVCFCWTFGVALALFLVFKGGIL